LHKPLPVALERRPPLALPAETPRKGYQCHGSRRLASWVLLPRLAAPALRTLPRGHKLTTSAP
jgi:hypothetical protein